MKKRIEHSTKPRSREARAARAGKSKSGRRVARFWHSHEKTPGSVGIFVRDGKKIYVAYVRMELRPAGTGLLSALEGLPDHPGDNLMNSHYVREAR